MESQQKEEPQVPGGDAGRNAEIFTAMRRSLALIKVSNPDAKQHWLFFSAISGLREMVTPERLAKQCLDIGASKLVPLSSTNVFGADKVDDGQGLVTCTVVEVLARASATTDEFVLIAYPMRVRERPDETFVSTVVFPGALGAVQAAIVKNEQEEAAIAAKMAEFRAAAAKEATTATTQDSPEAVGAETPKPASQ